MLKKLNVFYFFIYAALNKVIWGGIQKKKEEKI